MTYEDRKEIHIEYDHQNNLHIFIRKYFAKAINHL